MSEHQNVELGLKALARAIVFIGKVWLYTVTGGNKPFPPKDLDQ